MDVWDAIILSIAAYLAITSLVRLMAGRRNELIDEVRDQLAQNRSGNPSGSEKKASRK